MKRKSSNAGFTLIELMIVVAIIAIIAAIAIPNLLAARLAANETAAVSTLRNIGSCQSQFQTGAKCDVDTDGTGEFGMFRELSGAAAVRTAADGTSTGTVLNPAVLSGSFRTVSNGGVTRSGYFFRMWLQGTNGSAIGENDLTTLAGGGVAIATDISETTWGCFAWPVSKGNSGNRTFFTNQGGDIVGTEYSGSSGIASGAGAAFSAGGSIASMSGKIAVGTVGRDGNLWKQVQ